MKKITKKPKAKAKATTKKSLKTWSAVQKKPAAADQTINQPLVHCQNLEDELTNAAKEVTPSDRRKFETALLKGSVSQAIVDGWKELANLGYGLDKERKKRYHIAAWKTIGFKHPIFQEMIKVNDEKRLEAQEKLLPWARVCVKFGTEAKALEGLRNGDIIAVVDPQDHAKTKYKIVEITATRSRHIGHERQVSVSATDDSGSLGLDSFLEGMEDAWSSLDTSMSFQAAESQSPPLQLVNVTDQNKRKDSLESAMLKAKSALANIAQLKIRLFEVFGEATGGEAKAFAEKQLCGQDIVLQTLQEKYEYLLRNKCFLENGRKAATTPTDIKTNVAADSRVYDQIKASLLVLAGMIRK